jgi:voltage-dependent calcium channel L type alpha-1D
LIKTINTLTKVLAQQGLGKYCDPDFVRYTSREMQEALEMTSEEMDFAAHQLLQQEQQHIKHDQQPKAPPRQHRADKL